MTLQALLSEVYDRLLTAYGPQGWWPGDGPFETMVGAVLTQNTAWTNVEKALIQLRAAGAMSAPAIRAMPEPELAELIRSSGYFNSKARKLKALAEFVGGLGDDLGSMRGREPKELRADLLAVHGIGPETADDIVLYAADLPSFVIDTYTVRIVERMGFAPVPSTYEAHQRLFEAHLPTDAVLWGEYHALLDAHARDVCRKRAPACGGCCLRDLCATGLAAS